MGLEHLVQISVGLFCEREKLIMFAGRGTALGDEALHDGGSLLLGLAGGDDPGVRTEGL